MLVVLDLDTNDNNTYCIGKIYLLFQAASCGKCFLTDYRPDMFYDMCQMLRVLNAVRDYKIGIPLTYQEYPCCKVQEVIMIAYELQLQYVT